MKDSHAWLAGVLAIAGITAACAGLPRRDQAPASPVPAAPGAVQPTAGERRIDGFYTTEDISLSAGRGAWQAVGAMRCEDLLSMLAAGEWTMRGPVAIPGLAGVVYHAWLDRAEETYFVKASGSGPGLLDSLAPEANSAPPPSPTPTTQAEAPPPGEAAPALPPSQYCTAVLQPVTRQPLRVSGAYHADAPALVTTSSCNAAESWALLTLFIEGEGELRSFLQFQVPAELGEHAVDAYDEAFSLAIWQSTETFEGILQRFAEETVRLMEEGEGEVEQGQEESAVIPGEAFHGVINVRSLAPFAGQARLEGLATAQGDNVEMTVGFECDLYGQVSETAQAVSEESPGAAVQIEVTYDQSLSAFGLEFANQGSVRLTGDLRSSALFTYEGTFLAEGSGTFSDLDANGEPCKGTWSGSQELEAVGEAFGTELELSFAPSGEAEGLPDLPCLPGSAVPGSLPHQIGALYGEGSLTIRWPPEAPEARVQTIDQSLDEWIEVWQITLQAVQE